MDPEDDDLGKLERFIRAGGDLSSVPEATWAKAGGAPFRDKVTRFRAAGGNPAEITVPRASPLKQGTPMLGMLTPQHLAQNVRETTANEAMGYPTPFRGTRLPVGTPDPARDFVPEFQKNSDPLNNAAIGLRNVLREDAGKGGIVSHHLANALEGAGRWNQRTGQALAAPRDVWESIPGRVEARPTLLGKADELLGSGVQMAATTAGAFAAPMLTAPGVHEAMGAVMDPIVKAGESAKESTGSTLAQQLIEQGIPAVAGYVGLKAAPNVRPMVRGALERQRAGGITPDVAALAARDRAALVPEVRFEHGSGLAADAAKGPLRAEPVNVSVKRTAASSPELAGVVPESVNLAKPAVSVAEGKVGLAPVAGAVVDPAAGRTSPRATPQFERTMYHGSPSEGLTSISASPGSRQYDNATSVFGAFVAPNKSAASRYGKNIYETNVSLRNPYRMSQRDFYNRWQRPEKSATGESLPADKWASRLDELKSDASTFKERLIADGHDGIVVEHNGVPVEVASFSDIPIRRSAPPDIRYRSTLGTEEGFGPGTGPRFAPGEQPGIRAEAPAANMASPAPEATPAARKPWDMSLDEIERAYQAEKAADKNAVVDVFGEEGAKRYRAAQAKANSMYADRAAQQAADRVIEEMESGLTPEQSKRLFGTFDENVPGLDELRDYRDAIQGIRTAASSGEAQLGRALGKAMADIGDATDPAKMNHQQRIAYAKLREANDAIIDNGYDPARVSDAARRSAAGRFRDADDAAFMLSRFARPRAAQAPAKPLPAPTGPLKPVIPTEPPASSAPSTMGRGKSVRPKRGPLAKSSGSVDPALFTDFGNAVAKAVEPARAAWEKGTDAVAGAAAKAIDMVPGGMAVRAAIDDALTPVLNREMVGPRVTKGGSTEAMLSEQKRVGDVEFLRGKGERLIREVEKAQKRMTDAEVEAAHAWAAGEADALPTTMRPEARAAYEKLSGFIDETRKSLMDRGLISPEVYAEYPRFLSRIFREKVESGRKTLGTGSGKTIEPNLARADAWSVTAKMPMEDVQKHLAGLTDIQLQPINLPGGKVFLKFAPTEAGKAALDTFSTRVREAYKAGKADLSSAATDAIRKGDDVRTTKALVRATDDTPAPSEVLKIDKPLPAELRAELGEYRDTTTSASVTINAAARKIANYDNLVRMEDIGRRNGFVADKPKGGVVPQGFVEITSDRFGPLKGKIMDKEVHDAMFEAMDPKQQTALQKLASAWKRSHFLYNLPTHGRNLISIPILAEQAGVNMVANSKHWAEAAKNLYQRGKRYEEYVREGVIRQDLASAEAKLRAREAMKPKERAALDATIDTLIDVLGGDVTSPLKSLDGVKHARAFLEEAYAIPDDWLRAAKYEQLRASGMSKMEALSELNASTYNYNQQGPLTKKVTRVPIAGPAANFAYETYRINKNNAMRHPGRIVRSLVFLEAMRQALRSGDDHTPEEEAAYETMLGGAAPWRKLPGMSTIYPLGRDADSGNPEVYDSRFVDPLGNVKEGPRAGIEGAEWGKWGAEVALGGEHPFLNVLGLWMRDGKNSYGRQVYEEDDTVAEKAWKGWRETMAPPLASRQFDRLSAAFKGEQYSPNRPKQDPLEAVVSAITGFTWGEFDPGMTQDSLNRGMKAVEAKERRAYNRRAEAGQPERADDAVERLHSAMGEWSRRSDLLDAAARSKPKEPK